jgi:hypothetical protein
MSCTEEMLSLGMKNVQHAIILTQARFFFLSCHTILLLESASKVWKKTILLLESANKACNTTVLQGGKRGSALTFNHPQQQTRL